jgi:hypothetical protein
MSNDPFEVQVQHFAALKSKYQATKYEDSSPSSLLYLILRKADLEFEITVTSSGIGYKSMSFWKQ